MTDLWRLTATEAVGNLRKRELSPLELVEAAAARIEAVEPKTLAGLPGSRSRSRTTTTWRGS